MAGLLTQRLRVNRETEETGNGMSEGRLEENTEHRNFATKGN